MTKFFGVFLYEFNMSIRRKGLWIAFGLIFIFFTTAMDAPNHESPASFFSNNSPWQEAGEIVYLFNMLIPLIAGILSADRLQRDVSLGLRELQTSTPIRPVTYVFGKFSGVLLSALVPMFIWVLAFGGYAVISGQATIAFAGSILAAFLIIVVPSFVFVVAFSLACPLIIPIRVYQILFTGYWFWGNFLSDEVFPTISGTLLNSSGIYALQGFFQGTISRTKEAPHTTTEAWLNIFVLCLIACVVLFVLDLYLELQSRRA